MWYGSKQIHNAFRVSRKLRVYLLVAIIFLLTASSHTVAAQTVDETTSNVAPAAPPPNDNFNFPQVLSNTTGTITGNNIDATKEPGEPNHAGDMGGHSVWYQWTHPPTVPLGISFSSRNAGTNFDTLIAVYTGTQVNSLTQIAANDDYGSTPTVYTSTLFFPTVPGTTYLIAVDGYAADSGTFTISWDLNRLHHRTSRFIGTGNSATTVFRPSTGTWWTTSSTGVQAFKFGTNGDVPTPADFDGDAITDYAVFRNGVWWVLRSQSSTYSVASFGLAGDKPMPGDYNGNGYGDYAVFRPSDGTWYVLDSKFLTFSAQHFGLNLDKPAARDYDGDGRLDLAVFRPSTGVWYIANSYDHTVNIVNWGVSEDIPMPGEFFVEGKADIAVWRPSNGTWYARSSFGLVKILAFGLAGDIPQVLDYDASSVFSSDFAVYRPTTGTWYILDNSTNQFWTFQFGLAGDIPASTLYPIQQ